METTIQIPINPEFRDGSYWGTYWLNDKEEKVNLSKVLGVGRDDSCLLDTPSDIADYMDRIGSYRYTFMQGLAEAKQKLDDFERAFEIWKAGAYLKSEGTCQTAKAIMVAAKTRSVSEQITKTTIESTLIVENQDDWTRWGNALAELRYRVATMEVLYRSVDRRGDELKALVSNLGFLLRKP